LARCTGIVSANEQDVLDLLFRSKEKERECKFEAVMAGSPETLGLTVSPPKVKGDDE